MISIAGANTPSVIPSVMAKVRRYRHGHNSADTAGTLANGNEHPHLGHIAKQLEQLNHTICHSFESFPYQIFSINGTLDQLTTTIMNNSEGIRPNADDIKANSHLIRKHSKDIKTNSEAIQQICTDIKRHSLEIRKNSDAIKAGPNGIGNSTDDIMNISLEIMKKSNPILKNISKNNQFALFAFQRTLHLLAAFCRTIFLKLCNQKTHFILRLI